MDNIIFSWVCYGVLYGILNSEFKLFPLFMYVADEFISSCVEKVFHLQ